jgi:hypothetical protein
MPLFPGETEVTDQVQIGWLIATGLRRVATGNLKALYRDPVDGRFWEITYSHSEWYGSGPARLAVVRAADAKAQYHLT